MDLNLSDNVVVVTGESLGIGRAVAKKFAAERGHVAISARHEEHLDVAAAMINAAQINLGTSLANFSRRMASW